MLVMIADTRLSFRILVTFRPEYRRLTGYTRSTSEYRDEGNQYPAATVQRVPRKCCERNRNRAGEFIPEQPDEDAVVA